MLSDSDVENFQKLYYEHFGKKISKKEACEKGIQLLQLISLVYKPMSNTEFNFVQARQNKLLKN